MLKGHLIEKQIGLSERRHRKRVKRDIMKPPTSPEKENSEENPPKVSRKMGKGPTTRTKVQTQAGFALMHGLSATNVGKNRLTVCLDSIFDWRKLNPSFFQLNPLVQNVGVFKKGKASRVAKLAEIMSKKQGGPIGVWTFLFIDIFVQTFQVFIFLS